MKNAFAGPERLRVPMPDGKPIDAEVAVGNGIIETADASERVSRAPTDDHPSGDRWGALKDAFGNRWYLATPKGWTPGPEGLRCVQSYLHFLGAHKMIPFMEAAFGAEAMGVHKSPEGIVMHASMRIGNTTLEIDDAQGNYQPKPCHLHVCVPDAERMDA